MFLMGMSFVSLNPFKQHSAASALSFVWLFCKIEKCHQMVSSVASGEWSKLTWVNICFGWTGNFPTPRTSVVLMTKMISKRLFEISACHMVYVHSRFFAPNIQLRCRLSKWQHISVWDQTVMTLATHQKNRIPWCKIPSKHQKTFNATWLMRMVSCKCLGTARNDLCLPVATASRPRWPTKKASKTAGFWWVRMVGSCLTCKKKTFGSWTQTVRKVMAVSGTSLANWGSLPLRIFQCIHVHSRWQSGNHGENTSSAFLF